MISKIHRTYRDPLRRQVAFAQRPRRLGSGDLETEVRLYSTDVLRGRDGHPSFDHLRCLWVVCWESERRGGIGYEWGGGR